MTGSPEAPAKAGVSAADIATGMGARAAVLEALLHRQKTGRAQAIEVAMFDGMADWTAAPLLHYEHADRKTRRYGLAHASIYSYRPYSCRCGGVIIVAIQQGSEWSRRCSEVLDRNDLFADERFATNAWRIANRDALDAEIEPIFAAIDREEAIRRLDASQIAWGKLTEVRDVGVRSALRRMSVRLPNGSEVRVPRPAGRSPPSCEPPSVPAMGAHTSRIRAEFAR